ncbi:MAG: substrate-binding domain-containing protein [Verrucomicrobia bacterium]|jgi:ribose transport system substrate-binding protein|nr:substrate-binding domain-containing protein [Verrucomicrobiota bacterium]
MTPNLPQTHPARSVWNGKRNPSAAKAAPAVAPAKKLHFLLLALCSALLFQACDKQGAQSADGRTPKRLHLAFVANSPGEFWAIVNLGCDIAAQQLGDVDVDFRYPTEATVEAQQQILTNLLASGVDGIAISPIDAEKQTDFLNAIASKTLLVCADSDAAASKRVSYIGTDNVAAGGQVAELIKEALPSGGDVAVFIGYAKAQNTIDRLEGIRRGLAGSKVRIVETREDGQSRAVAEQNARDTLAGHPGLAGVVGISGYHGPALRTAVQAADKVGAVQIVCFDDNTDTLTGILAGDIHGTIAQNPFQIGKQTIVHMDKYLRGDKSQLSEPTIYTSSRALTKTNVEHYIAEQKNISFFLKDGSL